MVVFAALSSTRTSNGIVLAMRQLALIAAKIAVSATLLYFAMRRIDLGTFEERLSRIDWGWIAAAVAILLVETGLVTIRWRRIARSCGAPMSVGQALRFNLIASFFGQVLPSTVGGDAARIWLLARSVGWRAASYSVLVDRFCGVLALAAVVAACLYWSFALIANPLGRLVLLAIGLGSLAGGTVFLLLGYWTALMRWKLTQPIAEMSVLSRQLLFSLDAAPLIVISSVIVHLLTAAIGWSVARATGAQLGYVDAVLLILPVMLIATLPISIAGWGVRESALVLAFSYAGLSEGDGLIVSILFGLVTFAVGIMGGLVWLTSPDSPRLATAWNPEAAPQEQIRRRA